MIQEVLNHKMTTALTSDRWHVVLAKWTNLAPGASRFVRSIVSEHDTRDSAATAALGLRETLKPAMIERLPEGRDQVFVRRPGFKSLKSTNKRMPRRRK
jgi:hypothetical protein